MSDHEPILSALRDLKQDMKDGFDSLGKRMDSMEGDLKGNIRDTATLTERVSGLSSALEEEKKRGKDQAEKSSRQVSDLYDKDREVLGKVSMVEKRILIITAAVMVLVEGGKGTVLKLLGM